MNAALLVKEVTSQKVLHPLVVWIILLFNGILDNQLVPFLNAAWLVDRVMVRVRPVITVSGSAINN
jgi:hypothetical protein